MRTQEDWQQLVDNYEFAKEYISVLFDTYIFSNAKSVTDKEIDVLNRFLSHCKESIDEALVTPRAKDGKSFLERAAKQTEERQTKMITADQAKLNVAEYSEKYMPLLLSYTDERIERYSKEGCNNFVISDFSIENRIMPITHIMTQKLVSYLTEKGFKCEKAASSYRVRISW
jgi:hypothetical protein